MNFLPKWLLLASLWLMAGSSVAADKSQLYGFWKGVSGSPIKLHLKKDMKYVYQYKMLTFSGKWSVNSNVITLNYKVLGSQRKKKSTFSLSRGFLTLRSNEHSTAVLKKVH